MAAKRQAAVHRYHFARGLHRHADQLMRDAETELKEIEIAEKVYRNLPASEEKISALLESAQPERLWNNAQRHAAMEMAREEGVAAYARQKDAVVAICREVLSDGLARSTDELHAELQKRGVQLRVQNPTQRVSQILSENGLFKSMRGRGWVLDAPTAADSPRAKDEWEEKIKRQARRVVLNADGSAR